MSMTNGIGDSFVELPHETRAMFEAYLECPFGLQMRVEARSELGAAQLASNGAAPTAEQIDLLALSKIVCGLYGAAANVRDILSRASSGD